MMMAVARPVVPGFETGAMGMMTIPILCWLCQGAHQLGGHQLGVEALALQKLMMVAMVHQLASVKDHNLMGITNCGQTVSYDQGGPPFHQPLQRLPDLLLIHRVQVGSGFVQHQHRTVLQ